MSVELEPARFTELLERSFATEPALPPYAGVWRAGRRRLLRQRAVRGTAALGVAAVVVASYAGLAHGPRSAPVATLSDATVVQRCLGARVADSWFRHRPTRADVARTMGQARLMTRASTTYTDYATLRSADGRSWMACSVTTDERSRESTLGFLFRTDVTLPTRTVGGRTVDEPFAESDPVVASSGSVGAVTWDVDCYPRGVTEDTHAFQVASARCATFSVWLNNRLPASVAEVRVTNPDGTTRVVRPRDGYVSYGYRGQMTPQLRREYRALPGYRIDELLRVVYVARDGSVLARGSYPTLDVTLRKDQRP